MKLYELIIILLIIGFLTLSFFAMEWGYYYQKGRAAYYEDFIRCVNEKNQTMGLWLDLRAECQK